MLDVRVPEIYALARLEELGKTVVFAQAFANSAKATYAALKRIIDKPKETAEGVPAGLGRFFKRAAKTARKGVEKGKDALTTDEQQQAADKSPNLGLFLRSLRGLPLRDFFPHRRLVRQHLTRGCGARRQCGTIWLALVAVVWRFG